MFSIYFLAHRDAVREREETISSSTSSSTSSAHPSEALVRHFQSDAISLLQHLGQRQWLGQLVAHEVLAGPELALVEGFGLDTIALQPAQRGLGLTQPHPTDHHMAEALHVQVGIGQSPLHILLADR